MSTATREFAVGQKLWYVSPKWLGRPGDIYVTKVGRKWISFAAEPGGDSQGRRFNRETLWVDGYGCTSPGDIYMSREEWIEEVNLNNAISSIREAIGRYGKPSGYLKPKHLHAIMEIITEAKDQPCEPST